MCCKTDHNKYKHNTYSKHYSLLPYFVEYNRTEICGLMRPFLCYAMQQPLLLELFAKDVSLSYL